MKYWYRYFAVLSGGYIYFYSTHQSVYPETYFYLKNAVINLNTEDDQENSLTMINCNGEICSLALNTVKSQNEWEEAISAQVF